MRRFLILGSLASLLLVVGAAVWWHSSEGNSGPSGNLQVTAAIYQPQACRVSTPCAQVGTAHRDSLTCGPAGGTMPNPRAACDAIDDLVTHHRKAIVCLGPFPQGGGRGATAAIVGTFAGRPFRLVLTPESWCGQPIPVMRDYWILSTFPCSTRVDYLANEFTTPYADWPRVSGCDASDTS